jgi:hypothetical protein
MLTVKYIGMDRGKIKLSRKALLPGGSDEDDSSSLPTMAADEVDVIAMLTEGLRYIEIDIVL